MEPIIFDLKEGEEYIEMLKLLKLLRLVGTGGEAKMRIEDGEALVNGVVELRKRNKLRKGYRVEFGGQTIFIK